MTKFLNPTGRVSYAIAVCDRCKKKVFIDYLVSDPNVPGIRVCYKTCVDQYDPWRLPPKVTENISLKYPRPDTYIDIATPATLVTSYIISETGDRLVTEGNRNLVTEDSVAQTQAPLATYGIGSA